MLVVNNLFPREHSDHSRFLSVGHRSQHSQHRSTDLDLHLRWSGSPGPGPGPGSGPGPGCPPWSTAEESRWETATGILEGKKYKREHRAMFG